MTGSEEPYPRYGLGDFIPGFERARNFSVTLDDLSVFADASGDHHPLHRDRPFSQQRGYPDVLVHGMLVASRCSAFVAHEFVGRDGLLISMSADFRQPVYCGEVLVWRGEVARVTADAGTVELNWKVTNERGTIVQRGTACAWLPAQ